MLEIIFELGEFAWEGFLRILRFLIHMIGYAYEFIFELIDLALSSEKNKNIKLNRDQVEAGVSEEDIDSDDPN